MTETQSTIHAEAVASKTESLNRNVALLTGLTGLVLFGVMGLLGLAMRLTQAEVLGISDDWFYRIMTLHGAGMLVAALLAMMGGLWYFIHEFVTPSTARMIASYISMVLGAVIVVVAVVFGGFATGWTFLWPLPYEPLGAWSEWATVVFLIGLVFVGVGFQIYCLDLFSKLCRKHRGIAGAFGINFLRNRGDDPPKPPEIAAVVVSLIGLFALAIGVTIIGAQLGRAIDPKISINPLWAKNLTYFFGHTVMNLIIYLGAGIIYVMVPKFAGRPWKTTKPIVIAWLFTTALVVTAYGHHLYLDFVQPRPVSIIASVSSFGAALPVAVVTVFTGMMLVWGSRYRWTLASSLVYIGFVGWTVGGVGAVVDSVIPVNFSFHNTLWVPAHFHTYLLLGAMLWIMAYTVYLLERASGMMPTKSGSIAAPSLMTFGGLGLVGVWYASGALGVPRRYAEQLGNGDVYSLVASGFVIIFALGFAILLAEIARLSITALKSRGTGNLPAIAGGSPDYNVEYEAGGDKEFAAPLGTTFQLGFGSAVAALALLSLVSPVTDAIGGSVQWHHVGHAAVFFLGSMVAIIGTSIPTVWNRFKERSENMALATVILAPALTMIAMIPRFYEGLENATFLHGAYHLIFLVLGIVTGLGAARLGRTTAWVVVVLAVSMGLLYAGGVSGAAGT